VKLNLWTLVVVLRTLAQLGI